MRYAVVRGGHRPSGEEPASYLGSTTSSAPWRSELKDAKLFTGLEEAVRAANDKVLGGQNLGVYIIGVVEVIERIAAAV